jgi:hypothetical protein
MMHLQAPPPLDLYSMAKDLHRHGPPPAWLRDINQSIEDLADLADAACLSWNTNARSSSPSPACRRFVNELVHRPLATGACILAFAATHRHLQPTRSRDMFLATCLHERLLRPLDTLTGRAPGQGGNPHVVAILRATRRLRPDLVEPLVAQAATIERGYGDAKPFPPAAVFGNLATALRAMETAWLHVGATLEAGPADSGCEQLARLDALQWCRFLARCCAHMATDELGWLRAWLDLQLIWIAHIRDAVLAGTPERIVDLALFGVAPLLFRCDQSDQPIGHMGRLFREPAGPRTDQAFSAIDQGKRQRAARRQRTRRARMRAILAALEPRSGVERAPSPLLLPTRPAEASMLSTALQSVQWHLV